MASYSSSYSYVRRIDRQPVFNFRINSSDFYINTYGFSMTEVDKSESLLSDGIFYVLNKNNNPLYFNNIQAASIKFRNENGYPGTSLTLVYSGKTYDDVYRYDNYAVRFKGSDIGLLTVNVPVKYDTNNHTILYPFQSIEMGMTYRVLNVNKVGIQYYGYSKTNPKRTKGIFDISFNITSFTGSDLATTVTDTMVVSICAIYSKYVPTGNQSGLINTFIGSDTPTVLVAGASGFPT